MIGEFFAGRRGPRVSSGLARDLAEGGVATQTGMTNEWLAQQGLLSIRDLWMKAQGYV